MFQKKKNEKKNTFWKTKSFTNDMLKIWWKAFDDTDIYAAIWWNKNCFNDTSYI